MTRTIKSQRAKVQPLTHARAEIYAHNKKSKGKSSTTCQKLQFNSKTTTLLNGKCCIISLK